MKCDFRAHGHYFFSELFILDYLVKISQKVVINLYKIWFNGIVHLISV